MKKNLVLRLDGRFSGRYVPLSSTPPSQGLSSTPAPARPVIAAEAAPFHRSERRPLSEAVPPVITPLDSPEYFRL